MKFKNLILSCIVIIAVLFSCNGQKPSEKQSLKENAVLATELDSVSYCLGINMGQNLKKSGFDEINAEAFAQAMLAVLNGNDTKIDAQQASNILNSYMQNLKQKKGKANLEKGKAFLANNKSKEGVVVLPSGLQYKVLKEGPGPKPTLQNKVKCHYEGTLIDGTVFDSSYKRGQPIEFDVTGVIKGWTEALQLMTVGSKWQLFIPSNIAYGEGGNPRGGIGPNETLIFDVELIEISQ